MEDLIQQLPTILGFVAVVAVMALINVFVNKANKQKRYEAKVKAGLIKEDPKNPVKK
jgi:hypothetical protein